MERKSSTSLTSLVILVSMLFLSGISFAGASGTGCADMEYQDSIDSESLTVSGSSIMTNAIWDVLYSFDTGEYEAYVGIETDGEHIYLPQWNNTGFLEYGMDGTFVQDFTIAGVSKIRDMAYDGTNFYGSNASMTIYVMDLKNQSLVSTIAATCNEVTGVRHIAYDPGLDDGNGGLWIGNWGELGAIAMDGSELYANINPGNCIPSVSSIYGSAYDPWTAGGPYLWLFSQNGPSHAMLYQFDIATKSMTGVSHDCTDIEGVSTDDPAGGAATYDNGEKGILLVNIQNTLIVAYELPIDDNLSPVAEFACDPASPIVAQATSFDASASTDADGTIVSYEWDWETDGTYDTTGIIVDHTFHASGDYEVTLRVTDDDGVQDTSAQTLCALAPPVAEFACDPASPIVSQATSFDASASTDADGTIVSYEWDWETDGTYDTTGIIVDHTFHASGDHEVTLRVTDDDGVQGTIAYTVYARAPISPFAAFMPMERMHIIQANTFLSMIREQLPEDIPDNVRELLERVDKHMGCVSVTSVNPIYANGELLKAIKLLGQIQTII